MKLLLEIFQRIKWMYHADRLGPDMLPTYICLFFPTLSRKICKKKFKEFGSFSEIRPGAITIGCSKISIGEYVFIRPGAYIVAGSAEIIIEDKALIASGVQMHTENHKYSLKNVPIFDQGYEKGQNIHISKGAWIGANAVILPGVQIGENAVVAAGSVVTKNVDPYTVVAGVPARKIKEIK